MDILAARGGALLSGLEGPEGLPEVRGKRRPLETPVGRGEGATCRWYHLKHVQTTRGKRMWGTPETACQSHGVYGNRSIRDKARDARRFSGNEASLYFGKVFVLRGL